VRHVGDGDARVWMEGVRTVAAGLPERSDRAPWGRPRTYTLASARRRRAIDLAPGEIEHGTHSIDTPV